MNDTPCPQCNCTASPEESGCGACRNYGTVKATKDKIHTARTITSLMEEIRAEVTRAMALHAPFNSAHEGYAVMDEEVDELWDHVKVKQGHRDIEAMRHEAIQVAAMAIRFAIDICTPEKGQK